MALKLSDLVKKSVEKGYGSINNNVEKPWSQGNIKNLNVNLEKHQDKKFQRTFSLLC